MTDAANTMILTYRYRLLPTKAQHGRLSDALEHSRQLYNAALEERIDCYRKTGKGRSFYQQQKALTELRINGSKYAVSMERAPLKALHLAYQTFFNRGGFPRFKGREWFKSIGWTDNHGWQIREGRFVAKGIGALRIHMHRALPSRPTTARVKREGRHWYLCLTVNTLQKVCTNANAVGIDMGISTLAALSTGELIENARPYRRAIRKLRQRQRALSRCRRGSKRRMKVKRLLAAAHCRVRRSRSTYLHQVSTSLVNRFGVIAIEALNVKGLARGILAREVSDAAWTKLVDFIRYKAARAGSKLIEVDPRHTSQTCPMCGLIKAKALSERIHRCNCGCVLDRDVAAAKIVLLRAGVQAREPDNVNGYVERSAVRAAA